MGKDSKISWTHSTFNPWWGCARVSPGCERCYAEAFAKRTGKAKWGVKEERRFFGDKHWNEPLIWNRNVSAGERHRVFCASMADVFEDRRDLDSQRNRLWELIERTPNLDWLLLTKRPENFRTLFPWTNTTQKNIWLGCTVEDQQRAEERIPHLLAVSAAVRFLSCEPLLEPVDLTKLKDDELGANWNALEMGISWVICGGESGASARPFNLDWARSLLAQCRSAHVPFFMKQMGSHPVSSTEEDLFYRGSDNLLSLSKARLRFKGKADDIAEWPKDLQVQEFPKS